MVEKSPFSKMIVFNSTVASPVVGDRLYSPTTAAHILPKNSVGVFTPVAGSASPVAVDAATAATSRFLEIIKRRDESGDRSPLPKRAYERSREITLDGLAGEAWSGAPAELESSQSFILGAPEGSLDAIPVLDSTPYTMVIVGDGEKTDKRYGTSTLPTLSVSKTFGDFGVSPGLTAITTDQQARDYIVQGIVDKHNVLSSNQGDVLSIALAICTDNANVGAATAYDIAAITAMTTDDNLIIGYNADASPVNMVLSVENKAAIIAVLTAANTKAGVLTASVLQYAMPTPLTTAALGSTAIAGAAGVGLARADMIGILTVSIEEAYYDENYSNKRSLKIGLDPDSGFSGSVYVQESSMATVGSGQGVNIKQWHDNLNHYDQYTFIS
jgi:hypothetical protein